MDTKVDMTYSFLWDEEPTDEQLLVLMQEVGEDVRRLRKEIDKQVLENIERETVRVTLCDEVNLNDRSGKTQTPCDRGAERFR